MSLSPRLDGLLLSLVAQRYGDEEEARQAYASTLQRVSWRRQRGHKVCSRCRSSLPPSSFGVDASRADGLNLACKGCRRVT